MSAPSVPLRWTPELVKALPEDGNKYECLDGELWVSPAAAIDHQRICQRLYDQLRPYVDAFRVGELFCLPGDIELGDNALLQPDVFITPVGQPRYTKWTEVKALTLAVEVISPSSRHRDRVRKRRYYLTHGVADYWTVDPSAQVVERWWPGSDVPEQHSETIAFHPVGAPSACTVVIPPLFD